jgi:hypothetical protein
MTDLTPRQFVDAVTRSLKETGKRMAAKYRGAPADRPAGHKAGGASVQRPRGPSPRGGWAGLRPAPTKG